MATIHRVKYLVVHSSATKPSVYVDAAVIRRWHTTPKPKGRGWSDIGYHVVIKRDGTLEYGRSLSKVGAHVKGYNRVSLGICMAGGLNEETGKPENNYTEEQFDALHTILTSLKNMYPEAEVVGHRDLSPDLDGDGVVESHEWLKQCPCFPAIEWWAPYENVEGRSVVKKTKAKAETKPKKAKNSMWDDNDGW